MLIWFVGLPLLVLALLAAGGSIFVKLRIEKYKKAALAFDLSTIGEMESASLIYDREGGLMGRIFIQNRDPIPFEDIPMKLVEAVVAEEDNRYFKHHGVDYIGIARAALSNYRAGRITQGASTVTQQLARNSFNLKDRTYERKFVEIFLAERIERELSKDKIMELYLNRVYFGGGLYGAEAAARGYFGVAAKDMDIGQCAMLAGILKSPNNLSPWNNPDGAREIRDVVLGRMREMNFITRREYDMAREAPLIVRKRFNPSKQQSYALDFIRQQAISALGYDQAMNGGYRIYTTLDPRMQRTAEASLRKQLDATEQTPGYNHETYAKYSEQFQKFSRDPSPGPAQHPPVPQYLQGAILALENSTGAILTLVGGRDFNHNEYNRALQARRPAGTAFTPFVYATAYKAGSYPGELVQDSAMDNRYVMVGGETGILGEWGVETPENSYEGAIPMREALARGKNAATVRVGMKVGLDAVKTVARDAGIESPLRDFSNTFLGSSEQTLEELVLAYTIFPNAGWRVKKPYIIQRIEDADGKTAFEPKPEKIDTIPPSAAYQVHLSLVDTLRSGPSSIAYTKFDLGEFPSGGKSGTAYNFTDTYFFGYTNQVTCGVWVGFDKPSKIFRGAFGKDLALPVWVDTIMASAHSFPPQDIPRPSSLKEIQVARQTGLPADSAASKAAAKAMGIKEDPSQQYLSLATDSQIEWMEKQALGGSGKSYEEEEWPRAAAALDLATIRPIPIYSPTLVGFVDAYNSARPAPIELNGDDIPVARALPVEGSESMPLAATATAPEPAPADDREIRRAEPVRPMDVPTDTPAIAIEPPPPIKF